VNKAAATSVLFVIAALAVSFVASRTVSRVNR
jgi:multiple sugar transport system permease protein